MARTVDDVFASDISYRHELEESVSGFLIVSAHLTFLCASEDQRERAIMLVAPGLRDQWMESMPAYAGTMVTFAGIATVTGRLCKSGLPPLPYAFVTIRKLVFRNAHGMEAEYTSMADERAA